MSSKYKFQIMPRSQHKMLDMEFLGAQMLRDSKKLSFILRKFSNDNFVSFLAQFGVSTGEQGAVGITSEKIGESLIRWRVYDNTMQATKITDNSQLPGSIKANKPFVLGIDENWVHPAGIYLLEDMKTTLFVHKMDTGTGPDYNYTMSFISGDNTETLVRKDLLAPGRFMNYLGNARGELSNESQPMKYDQSAWDMFNVTQTMRHKDAASGHALSTIVRLDAYNADNLIDPANSGWLPFNPSKLIGFHTRALGTTVVYGRTNFNALERRVYTVDPNNARPEVPITSGVMEQMQQTEAQMDFNPYASTVSLMNFIDGAIASRGDYYRDPDVEYLIMTGNGGARILEAITSYKHNSQVSIRQELPAGNKISQVGINYQDAYYWTSDGRFRVMNTKYTARPRGWKSEQVFWKGASYDKDSFDMYVVPVRKKVDENGVTRRTIRLATKEANGVNRGLVLGSLAGMTGMYNGGNLDLSETITAKAWAERVMSMGATQIASPTDGELFMVLSEMGVVVEDPDDILWLKAKFNNQPNN